MSDTTQAGALPVEALSLEQFVMELENNPLKLRYVLTATPNPIHASQVGGRESVIDVQVMISNPTQREIQLSGITLRMTVGDSSAAAITAAQRLPDPVYDRTLPLEITVTAGTVTIKPTDEEEPITVTDTIFFTLPRIVVNTAPGVAPVKVSEIDTSGRRTDWEYPDGLVKLEADFPVVNFRADPAELDNLDKPTTLYWDCTAAGQNLSYSLKALDWRPKECLNDGICFSCADGAAGVMTPGLSESVHVELSVFRPKSTGGRELWKKVLTYVQVEVPSIAPTSGCKAVTRNGRLLEMRWLATNAVRCSLRVNGVIVMRDLPTNTYSKGFFYVLNGAPGLHHVSVIAYGRTGVPVEHLFPPVLIGPSVVMESGGMTMGVMIGPDGRSAYAGVGPGAMSALFEAPGASSNALGSLALLDLTQGGEKIVNRTPVDIIPGQMVISADGKYMVVAPNALYSFLRSAPANTVAAFDIAKKTVSSRGLPVTPVYIFAVAPFEGSTVLSLSVYGEVPRATAIFPIDVSGGSSTLPKIPLDMSSAGMIVITPDRKTVLATAITDNVVRIIDIARGTVLQTINVDRPTSAALTLDGAFCLVAGRKALYMIDMASPAAPPVSIPVETLHDSFALNLLYMALMTLSKDGKRAYLIRGNGDILTIVDVAERQVLTSMPIPTSCAIAVAPDGTIVLSSGSTVTIL